MRSAICHSYIKYATNLSSRTFSELHSNVRTLRSSNLKFLSVPLIRDSQSRWKSGKDDISSIVIPVPITPASNVDDINVGEELSKKINKDDILKIINEFSKLPEVTVEAALKGLNSKLFQQATISFRNFCINSEVLPVELHVIFSDILQNAGHVSDLLPYFLDHAREIFPHLNCLEDLKQISDLRTPANWYPKARQIKRKLIFHAGPTNSGKTYRALERFIDSKSGVYCGPLKLLSVEVFNKTNERGTPCDLVTGEERKSVLPNNTPADHVACTIEMVSVENKYEVAVIDEIQMIRDPGRGWAWTRALLGLVADEIHICGEAAAIDLVKEIASSCGEIVEVREYKRLTPLSLEDKALVDLNNIQPGDCIVCFNKNDIFNISLDLEKRGYECAVIYGGLPPGAKLAQAKKFNDPNHPCKILVATDAIGMGLNLSIRRVIFHSLVKPTLNEKGEKEMDTLSTSQALQIGGRAGRFNTQFSEGHVTTFRSADLPILKTIMGREVEVLQKAGLHPTAEQVELFAYFLPKATLSNLIDIFISLCMMDTSSYFMCETEGFKYLADQIQNVALPLRARYVFCCAPINRKLPFVIQMFCKFSRQYSQNEAMTASKLCKIINWPLSAPQNIMELVHQEAVFDVLDLYLWLSYRFPDLFPDVDGVRRIQRELDEIIQQGVFNIIHLIKASDTNDNLEEQESNSKRYGKSPLAFADDFENDDLMKFGNFKDRHCGKGRLTQELLDQGLITPKMLQTLQREWEESLEENQSSFNPLSKLKKSKIQTRRNKKK